MQATGLIFDRFWLPVGASPLSFGPRLLMNDHHQKDGKSFKDKEPIDSVTETDANDASRFSGGDFFREFWLFCGVSPKDNVPTFLFK